MHDPRSNRMAILALMLGAPTLMAPTLTPPSLPGNRAPEEPALGSIEIADAEIAGDISACADLTDFGPCSLRVALFAADADVLADPPLQSATVNAGADGPDWSFSGLSAETAYQLVAYASDGDATVYSGPVAVATRDALPIPPRVAHPGIEPENRYAGFLEGAFDVSLDGSAGYEIQIAVPPGTAGLEPALAFTYDSRSGNGTLGMGFALTGLSEIGRCPPNLFVQGIVDPIDFDDNDVFCLDGEPLVAVRGAYGAHETEYRTVLESFAKIVSYGGAGTDPDWFRVWTKGGRILDYGHSVDSRLEVEGRSEARLWAVNQIGDRFGNTMTVSYFEDPALGEHWPWRIDYTGNEAAGVAPYNQIAFEYSGSVDAPRPDPIRGFFAGGRVENPRRLEHVKTYARNADASGVELVFDYQIRYESGAISGRSRIESISQCDARGACLPPTRFLWSDAPGTTSPSRTGDSTPPVSERVIPVIPPTRFRGVWDANANETAPNLHFSGDVNGDGLTDIIRIEFDNPYYGCADCAVGIADVKFGAAIARGDGTYTYTGQDPGITQKFRFNQSKDPWMVGDANGDGRTDIFNVKLIGDRYGPNGYPLIEIGVWTSTGKGTFSGGYTQTNWEAHISLFESSWHEWAVGDADGDGADDVIGVTPQIPYIYADPTHGYDCDNPGPTFVELRVAYGGSDARAAQTTPWLAWPTYGGCSTEFLKDLPASMGRWRAVDLNGDGRVDVVGLAGFPRIDGLYTAFSTDQGFEVVAQPEPFTFTWATESGTPGAPCAGPTIYCWEPETFDNYMTALDMNADGNTDLVFIAERADPLTGADIGTQTFWTWLSRGDGSYQKQYTRTRIPTNYHVGYFLNNYANPPQAQLNSARVHVHDINGDALPDLTILRDYQYPIVLPFAFRRWDLLSRSDGTFEVLPVIQEGSWGATMSGAPLGYNSDMGIAGSEGELSGDVNGDGKLDWIYFSEGAAPRTSGETLLPGIVHTLFADGNDDPSVTQKSDLLVAIRNGADDASVAPRVTEIRYATLAQAPPPAGAPDTRAYSPSSHVSAADPELRDVQDGRSVVAFHSVSDGIGGARSYKHHYWGHREHTGLRESFGFESISVEDVAAGITETTDTLQHFPLQRQPASRTLHAGDVLLERTAWRWSERTLQPGARHSAREDSRVTWLWEPNAGGSAAAFRTEVRDFAYDAYDNVVHDAHYWGDGEIAFPIDGDWSSRSGSMFQEVLTTIHHPADEESWLVSRIARQSVSAQLPDGGAESEIVRTTEFPSYWEHRGAPTGAPARRVDEPTPAADEPWTHRVTHWAYDAFGNAILETLSDSHDAP
ncbi:MAG: hypothetical protein OEY15_06990, partial [Myxococcales bacterium]|nr:hypothetical protein [Myxococcales bacterium]